MNKNILFTLVIVITLLQMTNSYKTFAVPFHKINNKVNDGFNAGNSNPLNNYSNANPPISYENYTNQYLGISFNKPSNWKVLVVDGTIYIRPSNQSPIGVFLSPILRTHLKTDALSFIRFAYERALETYPDLILTNKKANSNNTMAEVSAIFKRNNALVSGYYMISIDNGRGLFCGYEDLKNNFDDKHTVLKQILKSLKIQPAEFYKGTNQGQFYEGSAAVSNHSNPTIDTSRFVLKASLDRTMYIMCPSDWRVNGNNYYFLADSPDGKMGNFTSNDHQPKTFDLQTYLLNYLMPFMKCSKTMIAKVEPNHDYMNMLKIQGIPSNAANFYGETTNDRGIRMKYAILLSASNFEAYGTPGGYVTSYGAFAVPELFDRNYNILVAMALSMTADNSLIMGNLRENLDKLNAVSNTISQTGDVTINMVRSSAANTDRVIDKYNYYLSGEEARLSPLENKIYVIDSKLDAYASNPNYPKEMLTNVPDKKWNKLNHDRTYAP